MLVEEVDKRSGVRWESAPAQSPVAIQIRTRRRTPRRLHHPHIAARRNHRRNLEGNDARGVLFGIGRLLRELRIARGSIQLPDGFAETSAPRYALRGHQLGYRPKSNTYDAWSVPRLRTIYPRSRRLRQQRRRTHPARAPTMPPTARISHCRPCA